MDIVAVCSGCQTTFVLERPPREPPIPGFASCSQCWGPGAKLVELGTPRAGLALEAFERRGARIRLRWWDGPCMDGLYPRAPGVSAVSLAADGRTVTVAEADTGVHRFVPTGESTNSIEVFEEQPRGVLREAPSVPPRAPLHRSEMFAYRWTLGTDPWGSRIAAPLDCGDGSTDDLLGPAPTALFQPVGFVAGGGTLSRRTHLVRPAVFGVRLTLTTGDRLKTAAAEASVVLDRGLVDALGSGDTLHLVRTPRGGLGFSALRNGRLIVAVAAVTWTPLGSDVRAVVHRDRVWQRGVGPGERAPDIPFLHPISITSCDLVPRRVVGFHIRVWYAAWPPPDDVDECVAIARKGVCPEMAATASAHLLAPDNALQILR